MMKKPKNNKGYTLVEVILSVAIFAIVGVMLMQALVFAAGTYKTGKTNYEENNNITNNLEQSNIPPVEGNAVIQIDGNQYVVDGYYQGSELSNGKRISKFQAK